MAELSSLRQQAYQGLLDRGFSPAAAAGLAGNAYAESGYKGDAFNSAGGGQGALGMFQWRGDRQNNFLDFANASGQNSESLDANLDFLKHEIENYPQHAGVTMDQLNAFTDPREAAQFFRKEFERPGDDPRGYARASDEAALVYNTYSGLTAVPRNTPELKFPDSVKGGKDGALTRFADDADQRSRGIQDLTLDFADMSGIEIGRALHAAMPYNYGQPVPKPVARGEAGGSSSATGLPVEQRLAGSGVPVGAGRPAPHIGGGMPAAVPSSNPDQKAAATDAAVRQLRQVQQAAPEQARVSRQHTENTGTGGDEAGNTEEQPLKKPRLIDRIFPPQGEELPGGEREDAPWHRRSSFADALRGFGIGLSQMSGGDNVNIAGPMEEIRASRAARATAQATAGLDQLKAETAWKNAQTAEANANLSALKFGQDLKVAAQENKPLSEAVLREYAQMVPQLTPLIAQYADAAKATGQHPKELGDRINKAIDAHLSESIKDADGNDVRNMSKAGQAIASRIRDPNYGADNFAADLSRVKNDEEREELMNMWKELAPGSGDEEELDSYSKRAKRRWALEQESAKAENRPTKWANEGEVLDYIIGAEAKTQAPINQIAMDRAEAIYKDSLQSVERAGQIDRHLEGMDEATLKLAEQGGNVDDLFIPFIKKVSDSIAAVGLDEEAVALLDKFNVDRESLENLENGQDALAYILAKEVVKGQGSVTDKEREKLLSLVARSGQNPIVRLGVIRRMKALNAMDRAMHKHVHKNLKDDGSNYREIDYYRTIEMDELMTSVSPAIMAMARAEVSRAVPEDQQKTAPYSDYHSMTSLEKVSEQSPLLSLEEMEKHSDMLTGRGFGIDSFQNKDTMQYHWTTPGFPVIKFYENGDLMPPEE